jgi:hypothetical protein
MKIYREDDLCENPAGCGFCNCTVVSPQIPTLTISRPLENSTVTQGSTFPLDIRTTDDGAIKRVNLWISSATPPDHCSLWPPWQLIKFKANDTYTYDCFRDFGVSNCSKVFDPALIEFDTDLLEPHVCNGSPLYKCAVMGEVEDDVGKTFMTFPWVFFDVVSCGNGKCETEWETPENCPQDCEYYEYPLKEQLKRIFDMVKVKIKIWR